jgi:hypothetical protein
MLANIPSVLIHRSISVAYMITIYVLVLALTMILYRRLPKRIDSSLEETQPLA